MKKILPIIVFVLILALLIPLYSYIIRPSIQDDTQEEAKIGTHGETLSSLGRPFIIGPMSEDDISVLKVTNAAGGFEFFRAEDNEIYLRGAEQHIYNSELRKKLYTNAATYLLAIEKLEEHDDLAVYALTPETALATVEITDTNGNYYKLYIGDKLATGGSYYAMLDGRDAVYVLDTMLESVLFCSARDYIMPLMLPSIDQNDYASISSFAIKKDGEPFIEIVKMTPEEEAESIIYGQHKMTFPAQYTPSAENFTLILQSFISFTADRVLEFGITEEMLRYYGFTTGMKYEINFSYGGVDYVLYFSGKTDDNTYYVYSPMFDLIGEISEDKVSYLEWELIKFVDQLIFMIDINSIAAIDLTFPNGTAAFLLTGEGDTLSVTYNGKAMDTTSFRYFYKSLMSIAIEGYETLPEDTLPYVTLKITTRSGQVLDFAFYEVGSLKSFFTLNGKGQFYVHRDHLRGVISTLSKIAAGEIITE